ncbi:MAG: hypothetical protein A2Y36_18185 [Treponema sp. GWA1_62_8]|nr:MAG: hypothetical protein A2Y36_18185 [Treponema sp. GWA1_62_8]
MTRDNNTERSSVVASRVGQGRFRDESIRIWRTCCVSGFTKEQILIASHIKPWRVSDNRERLDVYNLLLLVPTYDRSLLRVSQNGDQATLRFLGTNSAGSDLRHLRKALK